MGRRWRLVGRMVFDAVRFRIARARRCSAGRDNAWPGPALPGSAEQSMGATHGGWFGWTVSIRVRLPDTHAWRSLARFGSAWLGSAEFGNARQGPLQRLVWVAGSHSGPRPEHPRRARSGRAWPRSARQGMVLHGPAMQGMVPSLGGWRVAGSHWGSRPQHPRVAMPGATVPGAAVPGAARHGQAGHGPPMVAGRVTGIQAGDEGQALDTHVSDECDATPDGAA